MILPRCDDEVFRKGELVLMTHSIPSTNLEQWVNHIAEVSGQRVDWHFAAGRACILALGDVERVRETIEILMSEHDEYQRQEFLKDNPSALAVEYWKPGYSRYPAGTINTAYEGFVRPK